MESDLIHFIQTDEGWMFLTGLKDLFNGEVVGYAMSERMSQFLVMHALFLAASTKCPSKGQVLHSDRGSQYCASDYPKHLRQFGMVASMSRKGDCWDTAPMESFWGNIEERTGTSLQVRNAAASKTGVQRVHRCLLQQATQAEKPGYLSPAIFTQRYYATLLAA